MVRNHMGGVTKWDAFAPSLFCEVLVPLLQYVAPHTVRSSTEISGSEHSDVRQEPCAASDDKIPASQGQLPATKPHGTDVFM